MNDAEQILDKLIYDFSIEKFTRFFREKSQKFLPREEDFSSFNDDNFIAGIKLGEVNFNETDSLLICAFKVTKALSERAGKKAQYEKAKGILKTTSNQKYSGGIFIFYDSSGNFRFSLVYPESLGIRRQWNNFRRFTYFVSREFTNKTFLKQIGTKDFTNLEEIKAAFSITAVTNLFYDEFFKIYDNIVNETKTINEIKDDNTARDFVLLFTIRTIFLGFIQKKKWIGSDEKFIQSFYQEYRDKYSGENEFYKRWMSPLFFEALNSSPGRKVAYGNNEFSNETEEKLQMAPFLNGGLFRQKQGYDTNGWLISDSSIETFFNFLFSHSFTIEENSLEDEDLQLNPEFLGIIFERLVNKADGAVYTPKPEVDLMCRLSLVEWLQKNSEDNIRPENLYELFFRESEKEEDQKEGSFSQKEAEHILGKLEDLSVCDPAVGSGAFLVGMMQVLDGVEQSLRKRYELNGKNLFERKMEIIKSSLYGVEIKEWAVWICQLRLWLSLFVDAPDELKQSLDPILPSLDFKVRQGDSLIQRVGSKAFPVSGHNIAMSKSVKDKITKLKNLKLQYFDNKSEYKDWELKQKELGIYEEILATEISDKDKELRILKNTKPVRTQSLFGDDPIEPEQAGLLLDPEKAQKLESEIKELQEQKKMLRNGGKPLVWSIEFADVFGEKGGFDIVIGNPPYVRQEDIADPLGKIKDKKVYKGYLQDMVKMDFPDYFVGPKTKINAQSDLYTYFYIRALRLLNPKGVHTFICSNSWLDVGYGVWLQEFILDKCPIELIIDNQAKRSFEAADINTIISIINAPQKKVDDNHLTKFLAFKKPFESAIFTENLIDIENANEVAANETYRVYPIKNDELRKAGTDFDETKIIKTGNYVGDKWGGKYLRAPDIYHKVINNKKDYLMNLNDLVGVLPGCYTGINDFFYVSKTVIERFSIEPRYLTNLVRNTRTIESLYFKNKGDYYVLNIPPVDKKSLEKNVQAYVEWGERQVTRKRQKTEAGIPWPKTSTVSNRKYWYVIPEKNLLPAKLFMQYVSNDRFYCPFTDNVSVSDRCYHRIFPKSPDDTFSLAASLNCTLQYLFVMIGRAGLGEGALKLEATDAKRLPVFSYKKIENRRFVDMVIKLGKRLPKSVFEECGIDPKSDIPIENQEPKPLPDRAELDNIVFDALELSVDERKDVYRAVCRLVWNRISKANSI